jgi:predicted dehydrogenase
MKSHPTRREVLTQLSATAALAGAAVPTAANGTRPAERIKIGQIGVAHGHATKVSVYRESPDYEVVGIVEPDPELQKAAANEPAFRELRWMTREQLLETPGLKAVLVETRPRDLLDNAEACVTAGLHVHLDKPAGESLPQYRRILDIAAKRKLLVQMGYMFRYNPAVLLLREFLAKGWLGEIFEVHAVMSKVIEPPQRKRLAEYKGGMMFELGCHVLDLVIGVLGKPMQVTSFSRHTSAMGDGLADNMLAVLGYPRALASIKSTALEVEGFDRRHLVVCGTGGTFHIQPLDNPAARISLSQPRGDYRKGTQDVKFAKFTRYSADAADMAAVIRGEKPGKLSYAFSHEHDLTVQETLLKACGVKYD